jgi:23S rRNA (cytosine1962-C5)-methyltransferase
MTEFYLPEILNPEDKSSPLGNCIKNNYRHLKKWAKRTNTDCFRIYDREICHHPIAIDIYAERFCVHYFSKDRLETEPLEEYKNEIDTLLNSIFGVSKERIFWRTRTKTKTTRQYEKQNDFQDFFVVHEYGVKFLVNLIDYIDTGLFLDHRETRKLSSSFAKGKKVLNLFSYTASFSVHAAMNGASYTKSVDMSNTYSSWARENFKINGLNQKNNEIVREDCLKFLKIESASKNKYDLIIIDPPTISRSKKMVELFDIQEDYISLINHSSMMLNQGGIILFSTNSRKFVLDESLFPHLKFFEITHKTIPEDFKDPKIHRCWKITIE